MAKWLIVTRSRSASVNILSDSTILSSCTTLQPSAQPQQAQRDVLQEVILQGREKAASCGTGEPQVIGGPDAVRARPGARRTFEIWRCYSAPGCACPSAMRGWTPGPTCQNRNWPLPASAEEFTEVYPLHSYVSARSFTSGVHVRQMRTMYWPPAARARRSCRLPLRLRAANIGRWQAAPACWQHANAQRLCRTPNGREVCFRPPLRRSRQVVTKKSKGCLSREGP